MPVVLCARVVVLINECRIDASRGRRPYAHEQDLNQRGPVWRKVEAHSRALHALLSTAKREVGGEGGRGKTQTGPRIEQHPVTQRVLTCQVPCRWDGSGGNAEQAVHRHSVAL